jgi:DNA adenine methylase
MDTNSLTDHAVQLPLPHLEESDLLWAQPLNPETDLFVGTSRAESICVNSRPFAVALPPPLKWAGGKRWLVPHIQSLAKGYTRRRLVEPFCGGLAIALGLAPERALLNDCNPHLVHFYSWLKRGLRITEPGPEPGDHESGAKDDSSEQNSVALRMANEERLFYEHRERFNRLLQIGHAADAEAAALFYYLNRTGFNGLCRFNRSGEFNVPFGQYKRINYTRDFSPYREAFANWAFTNMDFESVPLADDDFVYADPPYDVEFTQYSKEAFGWKEQERAAEWLARHKGPVILSNQATDRIIALYRKLGFNLRFLDAPRRISCTGDRTPAKEVLVVRNISD